MAVSFFILFVYQRFMFTTDDFHTAKLAGVPLELAVMRTVPDMAKGLSGQLSMPANHAMLFTYHDKDQRHFWMNGMLFPLDLVWLSDGVVVGISEQVPIPVVGGDIPRMTSPEGVNQVLELNAGFVAKYGVKIGDKLDYRYKLTN